jgi:hypothetical protein
MFVTNPLLVAMGWIRKAPILEHRVQLIAPQEVAAASSSAIAAGSECRVIQKITPSVCDVRNLTFAQEEVRIMTHSIQHPSTSTPLWGRHSTQIRKSPGGL